MDSLKPNFQLNENANLSDLFSVKFFIKPLHIGKKRFTRGFKHFFLFHTKRQKLTNHYLGKKKFLFCTSIYKFMFMNIR